MTTRVDQFLPILVDRDAVGRHVLAVDRLLTEHGIETAVYAGSADAAVAERVRPVSEWQPRADAIALYHVATGSPIVDQLLASDQRLVLDHHNITPPHFFSLWSAEMAQGSAWGVRQLHQLAPRAELGIGDSTFNEEQLAAAGCPTTTVAPILFDPASIGRDGAAAADIDRLRHDGPVWLFVGRLAPNKAQHDIIRAFAIHRHHHGGDAVLRLVGGASPPAYERALRSLVHSLDLDGSVEITGSVSGAELAAHYATADVFVCLSRHEGFCVPILEAFHHGVPVVALRSSAVTETVGSGGLLLDAPDPLLVAAAVDTVVADRARHASLAARGTARLGQLSLDASSSRFLDALSSVGL